MHGNGGPGVLYVAPCSGRFTSQGARLCPCMNGDVCQLSRHVVQLNAFPSVKRWDTFVCKAVSLSVSTPVGGTAALQCVLTQGRGLLF